MSVSDYMNSLSYLEVSKLMNDELKKINWYNDKSIKSLIKKNCMFDDALMKLYENNRIEEFMMLFFRVISYIEEICNGYYDANSWNEYGFFECSKYVKKILVYLDIFYEVSQKIDTPFSKIIINDILFIIFKNNTCDNLLSKGDLIIKMCDDVENYFQKENKRTNFELLHYYKTCIKLYSGDEEELEKVISNLHNNRYRFCYLEYLGVNQKYDELRKYFVYFRTRDYFETKEIYLFAKAFYVNKQYRISENILIKYCNCNYDDIVSNGNDFFDKIMLEMPNLDLNRIFIGIGFVAYENRAFTILKKLKEYNKNVEMLYHELNNHLDIEYLKTAEFRDNYTELVYGYLLLQKAKKMIFRSYSYYDRFDEVKKIIDKISETRYAEILLKKFKDKINSSLYGRIEKTYEDLVNKSLSKVKTGLDVYNDLVLEFDYVQKNSYPTYYIYAYSYLDRNEIVYRYEYFNKNASPICNYCLSNKSNNKCHHFDINKFELSLNTKESFEKYLQFVDNIEYVKNERDRKIISLNVINELIDSLKKEEIFLNNEQVHLTPVLDVEDSNYDTQNTKLSLKIGTSKAYVIKNITDFVEKINNNEVFQYGKGLSINHNINNFDNESKIIIDYLQSIVKNRDMFERRLTKSVDATPSVIDRIFNEYMLQQIIIKKNNQEVNCIYRNNAIIPEVEIKDNVLRLKDQTFKYIIYGNDFDYVIRNNEVLRLDVSKELRKIIRFCIINPEFKLNYVKKSFLEQVYTRVGTELTIDDDFKQNIKEFDLHIETYFSYDDDNIICLSKYFVNDHEISVDDMQKKKLNNYKLIKYQNMLESLGFVNNVISDSQNVMLFLSANLGELKKLSDVFLSEEIKKIQIVKFNKPKPYLGYDTNMLSICLKNFSYTNEELYKILQAIKKKQRFVKLNKDVIIDIDKENANLLLQSVNDFALDEKKLSEPQQVPLYYSLELLNQSERYAEYEMDDFLRKILNDIANYKTSKFEVPKSLNGIMRDYQIEGFKWMKILCEYNFSGILADDMGLGKTLQIISLIMDSTVENPSLIVCPKSLAFNWEAEFHKWNKGQEVILVYGTPQERQDILLNIDSKKKVIYITSYDSLKNDLDLYKKIKFEFIILDEAQYIKNHTTLKAQSVKKLSGHHKFVLTGTPIENSIVDLWSIFDFLMPNYLYSYSKFKSIYESEIVQNKNSEVKNQLVKKITPFILRRTKNEVLKDLPEKIETIQYVTMSDEIKKYYEAELLKLRDIVDDPSSKIQVLASFTRLRQLCVAPSLYIDNYQEVSPKLELTMNLVNELVMSNHKVIIFSQFTSVFEKLENMLKDAKIDYFTLTGKTKASSRVEMADIFNDASSKEKVFLVSLKAGGTGLNLTGADVVIHLDPWWNVAAEDQATGRAHRIGQKNVVNVIKIVCLDSIEQKVIELQNIKKEIITDIIADNDDNIQKLSSDDLKILLS